MKVYEPPSKTVEDLGGHQYPSAASLVPASAVSGKKADMTTAAKKREALYAILKGRFSGLDRIKPLFIIDV